MEKGKRIMRTTFINTIIENSINICCDSIMTVFNFDVNLTSIVNVAYNCLDIDH